MIKFYDITAENLLTPTAAITDFADLPPDSLYSAFRTFDGNKFLYLEEHLARTRRSVARMGWPPLDEPLLRRAIDAACTANMPDVPIGDVRMRYDYWQNQRLTLALIPFAPPPASLYSDGVHAQVATGVHRHDPLDKTAVFTQTRAAYLQAHANENAYEYLLSDGDALFEGFSSNFYGVRDGVLYTAGDGVLEGITRRIILQLLPTLNIPLRLEAVKLTDLPVLDEAAMSSSSRGLLPIVEINNQRISDGRPGPITRQLIHAYNAFVNKTIQPATGK